MVIESFISRAAKHLLVVCAGAIISCTPVNGAPVRDQNGLVAALQQAKGGETIRLVEGSFAGLSLGNRRFDKPVTIISDDPKRPAKIERVKLSHVSGVHFRDLEIGGPKRMGEPEYAKLVEVRNSSSIVFNRVFFHGSLDGDPSNDTWGAAFGDCSDIKVIGGRFEELFRAVVFQRGTNIEVSGNRFNKLRSDGANFDSVHNVRIEGNHFSNFLPIQNDHPDAIQFFNVNGPPSTDILISHNVLLEGEGVGPQGILMNTAKTGPFQRVRILNNLLYSSGAWHGILVETAEDVIVRGNTTLSRKSDDKLLWIALSDVNKAELDGNVAERIIVKNVTGAKVGDNLDLEKSPGMRKRIRGVDLGIAATEAGLIMPRVGYQSASRKGRN